MRGLGFGVLKDRVHGLELLQVLGFQVQGSSLETRNFKTTHPSLQNQQLTVNNQKVGTSFSSCAKAKRRGNPSKNQPNA